jgi:hypothetical protein
MVNWVCTVPTPWPMAERSTGYPRSHAKRPRPCKWSLNCAKATRLVLMELLQSDPSLRRTTFFIELGYRGRWLDRRRPAAPSTTKTSATGAKYRLDLFTPLTTPTTDDTPLPTITQRLSGCLLRLGGGCHRDFAPPPRTYVSGASAPAHRPADQHWRHPRPRAVTVACDGVVVVCANPMIRQRSLAAAKP